MNSLASVASGPTRWWGLVVLGVGWGLLFDRLRVDWQVNAQYGYGWFVPFLGVLLLGSRWKFRPRPESAGFPAAARIVLLGLLALQLPIRLVEEANPEWRLFLWVHALQILGVSLALVYLAGGASWVRHFGFPIGFLLVSVPWPMGLETAVVQGLMRGVAVVVVELLGLLGVAAIPHGNLIETSRGMVGVDEACSGVRSLQSSLLIALYLGESFGLRPVRRVLLVAAGLGVAVAANVGRAFLLTWLAATRGIESMERFHDLAGWAVLGAVLVALWWLTNVLARRGDPAEAGAPERGMPRSIGWQFAAVLLVWMAAVEVGTEGWYRRHEVAGGSAETWAVVWPEDRTGFREVAITEKARAMLRFTEGRGAAWEDGAGHRWQMFYFRWAPGRNSAQLASGHRPEICLPGSGLQLTDDLGRTAFVADGLELTFHQFAFATGGQPLHVFYGSWEGRQATVGSVEPDYRSRWGRFGAVLAGRRNLGQQVLEIALTGPGSPDEAAEVLEAALGRLVHSLGIRVASATENHDPG